MNHQPQIEINDAYNPVELAFTCKISPVVSLGFDQSRANSKVNVQSFAQSEHKQDQDIVY